VRLILRKVEILGFRVAALTIINHQTPLTIQNIILLPDFSKKNNRPR
jgi:hypothetical protein